MECEDFEILIKKEGSGYKASVTKSPAGTGESTFSFDKTDYKRFEKLITLVFADDFDEKVNDAFSRDVGSMLFEKLFSGDVKTRFHESLTSVQQMGKGLRITLEIPEELHIIPWEFLYDNERSLFLSRSTSTILARLPEVPHPPGDLTVHPPLKILIVLSHPLDIMGTEQEFDVERQRTIIENALEELPGKVYYEVLDVATVENILEKLRKGFDVLHFVGHGVIGGLLIEDDRGNSYVIDSGKFANICEGKGLKLVLLESCWSSAGKGFTGVAQKLLLSRVNAVIAMQYPIYVKSAEIFFSEFYKGVASGYSVDGSVSEARKAVYAYPGQNCLDWATPTLYMNAQNGLVFSLESWKPGVERHDHTGLYSASQFVGRRKEIWTLKKALNSDKRIVVVEGFAGIGKSVLVSKIIKDVHYDFKGVFAVRCTEGYSLDLFFAKLNQFFMNNGEYGLNVNMPSEEKIPLLIHVLQSKYLIVLDNFEVLLENGVKKDFEILLESLLIHSHRSKILITTRKSFNLLRKRLSGNVEHILLGGLPVIHSVWLMNRLGISASVDDKVRIYEKTGGHPYAIEFIGELLREESLDKILELPVSREDILDLMKEVFEKLEIEELSVLEQISVLRRPEYIEALEFLASHERGCIKNLLGKTVLFYDKGTELYYLHALVREYAYGQLKDKRKAHLRAAQYYEEVVGITEDIWDIVEVWFHNFEAGEYEKAGDIVVAMEEYLLRWGYWQLVKELLEKTVETTEGSLQGSSLLGLGIVYQELGEYEKALECYERSLTVFEEYDDKINISANLGNIGLIHHRKGDYEKALEYYEESLKIQEELGNKSGIANSLHNIGMIHHDKGDYEKALEYYEESLKIEEELGNKSGIADSLNNIGLIHHRKGD
ncbi:MAG: tetratricopeptide repeat protein, partial [Theionarchaea archaeon]|nr:tetratricopeptide repeat protein [Theionarchaea archaeon]